MEYRKLSELVKLENNPRKISEQDFERLKASIKKFGVLEGRPFLVSTRTGEPVIIGGNQRYEACKALGIDKVPVHIIEDLTEEEEREIVIRDNVSNGEWDWEMLECDEWDSEKLEDWGVNLPVFETVPEEKIEDDGYETSIPRTTDFQLGDIVEIGEHRIFCGDSTNSNHVEQLMQGELADLGFNDPPYGMKKEKDGVLNDNLNFDDLLKFNRDWIALQFSILKKNGSWYCWGIDEPLIDIYHKIIKPYAREGIVTFRNLITWDKGSGQGQNSELTRMFATADEKCLFVMLGKQDLVQNKDQFPAEWKPILEYFRGERDRMGWNSKKVIEITGKTSATHYFSESQFQIPTEEYYNKMRDASGGQAFLRPYSSISKESNGIIQEFRNSRAYFDNVWDNMNNVWRFNRTGSEERESTGGRATPKPLELCERGIKTSCPDGGLVTDFFLGSGSTMVACHKLGRICFGMELDPFYVQVIVDRMLKLDPSLVVKRNGEVWNKTMI